MNILFLENLAAGWLSFITQANLQGSFLLVLLLLLFPRDNKSSPMWFSILLVLVYIKMLTPPLFILPEMNPMIGGIQTALVFGENFAQPAVQAAEFSLKSIFFLFWFLGALMVLWKSVRNYFRLKRIATNGEVAEMESLKPFLPQNARVVVSREHHSPFVVGFIKHRIVLPVEAQQLDKEYLKMIVVHEAAHIRQGDHWLAILQLLITSFFYYNPLVYLANRRLSHARELMSDSRVLKRLQVKPAQYSHFLLEHSRWLLSMSDQMALGWTFSHSYKQLKSRMDFMFNLSKGEKMKRQLIQMGITAAIVLMFVVLFACGKNEGISPAQNTVVKKQGEMEEAVPFAELTEKPAVLKRVAPVYPEEARKNGLEGMVIVKILVDENGKVVAAEPQKRNGENPDKLLGQAAVDAARQFLFSPGRVNGKPVKTWMVVPFTFKLKK